MAAQVAERQRPYLRYVNTEGTFTVWDGRAWQRDQGKSAESRIGGDLELLGKLAEDGASRVSAPERRKAEAIAEALCSNGKAAAIKNILKEPGQNLGILTENLDRDPWVLNTPGGLPLGSGWMSAALQKRMRPAPHRTCSERGGWANAANEFVGTEKRLFSALVARKFKRHKRVPQGSGRVARGFLGIRLKDRQDLAVVA